MPQRRINTPLPPIPNGAWTNWAIAPVFDNPPVSAAAKGRYRSVSGMVEFYFDLEFVPDVTPPTLVTIPLPVAGEGVGIIDISSNSSESPNRWIYWQSGDPHTLMTLQSAGISHGMLDVAGGLISLDLSSCLAGDTDLITISDMYPRGIP